MENMMELIESYNQYIKKMPNGIQYIYENLRSDNIEVALEAVRNFSEGLMWLNDVATYFNNNNINAKFSIDSIFETLNRLNDGLEKADYFLVADIFEYELLNYFKAVKTASAPQ